eukprot:UN07883
MNRQNIYIIWQTVCGGRRSIFYLGLFSTYLIV